MFGILLDCGACHNAVCLTSSSSCLVLVFDFFFYEKKSNVNHSMYSVTMLYDLQPVHLNTRMLHEPGLDSMGRARPLGWWRGRNGHAGGEPLEWNYVKTHGSCQ